MIAPVLVKLPVTKIIDKSISSFSGKNCVASADTSDLNGPMAPGNPAYTNMVLLILGHGWVINSLRPSDTIWRHWSGSTLAQVMACCLTTPSHYLNQCWLIISKVQWHSSEGNFVSDTAATIHKKKLDNYLSKIKSKSPRGQWVKYTKGYELNRIIAHHNKAQNVCILFRILNNHDDVIKWGHFPRYTPFVRGIRRSRWIPRTMASDAELWCFLWSEPE